MMQFILSLIPLLIISIFFYIKKIKINNLINVIFWGIISIILTIILNNIVTALIPNLNEIYSSGNTISKFFAFLIIAGITEETSKYICLKASKPKSKNEIFTNLIYISLIFTIYEDYSYLGNSTYFLKLGLFRAATPCHLIFAVIMSLFLMKSYDIKNKNNDKKYLIYEILALIIPIILHGFYDFCVKDYNVTNLNIFLIIFLFILSYGITILAIFKQQKEVEINNNIQKNKIIKFLKIIFIILFTLFFFIVFKTNYTKFNDSKNIDEEKIIITINNIEEIKNEDNFIKVNVTIENNNNNVYYLLLNNWKLIGFDEKINAEYGFDDEIFTSEIEPNSKANINLYFKTKFNNNLKLQYLNTTYDKQKGKLINNKYTFLLQ